MTTSRPLTPLSSAAIESGIPRMRGRTPIPAEQVRLSVLIPVYNEKSTIRLILEQVRTVGVNLEVICVNDCSTDGTREVLDALRDEGLIDVLVHKEQNEGKGPPSARRWGAVPAMS